MVHALRFDLWVLKFISPILPRSENRPVPPYSLLSSLSHWDFESSASKDYAQNEKL